MSRLRWTARFAKWWSNEKNGGKKGSTSRIQNHEAAVFGLRDTRREISPIYYYLIVGHSREDTMYAEEDNFFGVKSENMVWMFHCRDIYRLRTSTARQHVYDDCRRYLTGERRGAWKHSDTMPGVYINDTALPRKDDGIKYLGDVCMW